MIPATYPLFATANLNTEPRRVYAVVGWTDDGEPYLGCLDREEEILYWDKCRFFTTEQAARDSLHSAAHTRLAQA